MTSIQNFSQVFLGRFISGALQAVFYIVFAIILEPEAYGNISYIISLAGVFSIIFRFGLNHSIVVCHAKNNFPLVKDLNTLLIIFTTIGSIILLIFDIYAALICFASSLFVMNIQNFIGQKNYKSYALIVIGKAVLHLILPLILYHFFDIEGILLGIIFTYFIFSIQFLKLTNFKISSFNSLKNNFKILAHNFGVDTSLNFVKYIDKVIIAPLFGFASLGIFQLNVQILYALEIFPTALHSYLLSEESRGNNNRKIIVLSLLTSSLIVICGILFLPHLVEEFFPKYSEGIFSLQILLLSLFPLTISSIFNAKLQAQESTKIGFSAIVRISSLVVLIVILGEYYGLVGLSLSVLLSSTLYMISLVIIYYMKNR